jgi:hypothetical protein
VKQVRKKLRWRQCKVDLATRKCEILYIFRCGKRKPGYPEVPGPKPRAIKFQG